MSERRRVDIGVASYRNPEKLKATLESIEANCHADWRCFVIHNPDVSDARTEDTGAFSVIQHAHRMNNRFVPHLMPRNVGYAGAVNKLFELAETPYVLYCDNDIEIKSPGWDEKMCAMMDAHPKIGQVFPGAGHFPLWNGMYHECLWNAGYCWGMRRMPSIDIDLESDSVKDSNHFFRMDESLGHHEEVDLMIRLRMAGYRIAALPDVEVVHHQTSTSSPESAKRIHAGVVRWMNKWNRYFCGEELTYPNPDPDSGEGYDPRALRYTDWPPVALYLERLALAHFPGMNADPKIFEVPGVGPMDGIMQLKPTNCYRERAI